MMLCPRCALPLRQTAILTPPDTGVVQLPRYTIRSGGWCDHCRIVINDQDRDPEWEREAMQRLMFPVQPPFDQ